MSSKRPVFDGLYRYKQRDHICRPSQLVLWDAGAGTQQYETRTWEHLSTVALNERTELHDQLVVLQRASHRGNVCAVMLAAETPHGAGKGPMTLRSLAQLVSLDDRLEVRERADSTTIMLDGKWADPRALSPAYWHGWVLAHLEELQYQYSNPVPDLRVYNIRNRYRQAVEMLAHRPAAEVPNQSRSVIKGFTDYKEKYA